MRQTIDLTFSQAKPARLGLVVVRYTLCFVSFATLVKHAG